MRCFPARGLNAVRAQSFSLLAKSGAKYVEDGWGFRPFGSCAGCWVLGKGVFREQMEGKETVFKGRRLIGDT